MKKIVFLCLLVLGLLTWPLLAQGRGEVLSPSSSDSYTDTTSMGPSIVASTSWVGAMAQAAGATNVIVLAPVELRHPPEYDFSPNDIIRATQADLMLWAGYEGFMRNLVRAGEIPAERVIQVTTNNAPDQLLLSVESLAHLFSTMDPFLEWKKELELLSGQLLAGAKEKETTSKVAAVQFHQQALARYLGYQVGIVYGPQDLTLTDIQKIEALNPDIIIDNWHSPQGEPLKKEGRKYVQLINFPGPFQTTSLLDVLRYNGRQLEYFE